MLQMCRYLAVACLLLYRQQEAEGQIVIPDNPCPSLFRYEQQNGRYFGVLEIPNDRSGVYDLQVNTSTALILNEVSVFCFDAIY